MIVLLTSVLFAAGADKALANVYFRDGSVKENVTIKVPSSGLQIQIDGKFQGFPMKEISHVVLWHQQNRDNVCLVVPMRIGVFYHKDDRTELGDYGWFAVHSAGEHLMHAILYTDVKVKKNGIKVKYREGYPSPYFLIKNDREIAWRLPESGRRGTVAEWVRKFLADDEVLCAGVDGKGYWCPGEKPGKYWTYWDGPVMYEKICADYTPGRKASSAEDDK
ncbi:MAG: hypothetical protein K2G30_08685 [Muribaculaceae bacterium]|nr:hypothetical protein [Muribaculaceae bacterium]